MKSQEGDGADKSLNALSLAKPNAIRILAIPARDESDKVGLGMLAECLDSAKFDVSILNNGQLASEVIEKIIDYGPAMICVAAVPPGGAGHARLLCLRLRARFPSLKILVGRWGYAGNEQKMREQLVGAGAADVAITLGETCRQIETLRALLPSEGATAKELANLEERIV